MIVSLSVVTVRKGHEKQVIDILNDYVQKEKKAKGCLKVYLRKRSTMAILLWFTPNTIPKPILKSLIQCPLKK